MKYGSDGLDGRVSVVSLALALRLDFEFLMARLWVELPTWKHCNQHRYAQRYTMFRPKPLVKSISPAEPRLDLLMLVPSRS